MKKALIIMAAALLFTQCKKDDKNSMPSAGKTVSMTVTAGPGSKTDITPMGGITWSAGDKLYVGDGEKYIGYLTLVSGGEGSATGVFTGDVNLPTSVKDGDKPTFHFFYLGSADYTSNLKSGTSTTVDVDFSSQNIYAEDGKLKNASEHHVGYGKANGTVIGDVVTDINVMMESKVALARFSFTKSDSKEAYEGALTLSGTNIYNKMTVGFGGTFEGTSGSNTGGISLTGSHSERYVMLVPTNETTGSQELTFEGDGASGKTTLANGIEANKFYGMKDAIAVTLEAAAPSHETVNFGTPNLYWSKYNLGATNGETKESWYGDYYAWGATETWYSAGGQTSSPTWKEGYGDGYSWAHCPFTNGTYSSSNKKVFTKYIPTDKSEYWAGEGDPDNKLVLESSDDAASVAWGSGWRMPTSAEWKSLYDNNTFEWLGAGSTSENVTSFTAVAAGYLVVKGKESSLNASVYMFLPAAGYRNGTSLNYAGSNGYYWSSSLFSSNPIDAYYMYFGSGNVSPQGDYSRCNGFSVRPVRAAR